MMVEENCAGTSGMDYLTPNTYNKDSFGDASRDARRPKSQTGDRNSDRGRTRS